MPLTVCQCTRLSLRSSKGSRQWISIRVSISFRSMVSGASTGCVMPMSVLGTLVVLPLTIRDGGQCPYLVSGRSMAMESHSMLIRSTLGIISLRITHPLSLPRITMSVATDVRSMYLPLGEGRRSSHILARLHRILIYGSMVAPLVIARIVSSRPSLISHPI